MNMLALLLASVVGTQSDFRGTIAVSLTHAQMVLAAPANAPGPDDFPPAPSPPGPGPDVVPDVPDTKPVPKVAPKPPVKKPPAKKPTVKKPAAPPRQYRQYNNGRGWYRMSSGGGCANGRCG